MAVAWLHRPYRRQCIFTTNPARVDEIIWRPAAPGAKWLPFPTVFTAFFDDEEQEAPVTLGEFGPVLGASHVPRLSEPPGQEWVGKREWFITGLPSELAPACGDGGLTFGGHATIPPQGPGGLTFGGSADVALYQTGLIVGWGTETAPAGWALCDGSEVGRADPAYATLFAVIGTRFGEGDGLTTFNLPDLRQRLPMGAGDQLGLPLRLLGQEGGGA